MDQNKRSLYTIFIIQLTIITNQAQLCHRFPSRVNPEILCNGFTNTLQLRSLPDQHISKLSFSKNNITTITSSSFEEILTSITEIYLDNNLITKISGNAFKNLPNLQVIDLSNNKLDVLDFQTFASNEDLITIDLAGNKITNLDINMINKLPLLNNLILSDNPLDVCNEATAKTLRYLEDRKIVTNFLSSCGTDRAVIQTTNMIPNVATTPHTSSTTNMINISENYIYLIIILGGMVFLALTLGCITARFCLNDKIKIVGRERTESGNELLPEDQHRFSNISSVDGQGYEIPKVPENPHHYIAVLEAEAPLIILNSQNDLRQTRPQLATPTPLLDNSSDAYEPYHVYEQIKENNYYGRNLQDHLLQPYSCVKNVPGK